MCHVSAGKRPGCLTLSTSSKPSKVGDVISRDYIFVDSRALPGVQCVIESWSEMQACTLGGPRKHLARSSQLPKASGKLETSFGNRPQVSGQLLVSRESHYYLGAEP